MQLLAHDPFISAEVAESLGVELVALDDLCARPTTSACTCP
jgi:phosphoglycerate dehydrogenase-like enzyme